MQVFTLEHLPEETELKTKMQYSLPGVNKDGGILHQSIYLERHRQRQYCNIIYLERTKMEVFTLEHLPEETEIETKMQYSLSGENKNGGTYQRIYLKTELETKMQYSLPGEDKDVGIYQRIYLDRQSQRQKCNILFLERTKMEVFQQRIYLKTELETKIQYSLSGENKAGGIYTRSSI